MLTDRLMQEFGKGMLEDLIDELIVLQEARKQKLAVSDKELDARVAQHKAAMPPGVRYEAWLKEKRFTEAAFRERLRVIFLLEKLVEPATPGDPMSPLRWTCKSVRVLERELTRAGHPVSHQTVCMLLQAADYSLQANRKTREGKQHPDRNAQFEHIAAKTRAFLRRRQPVISVDTKKKELIGDFKNAGREWRPAGAPEAVRVHDFIDPARGGLRISVCHFPPGTSKWNKIEHRMFCHITENWRGRPLISHEVVVNLIANTTTEQGLRIRAGLDTRPYPTGVTVTPAALKAVRLTPDPFHDDWNYLITPHR
jgi:hypothetical protein